MVLLKAGRTAAGGMAAQSHTSALAGSEAVTAAAFKQCGVTRADELGEIVDAALAFAGQPLPKGRRVGLLTMGGGLGVIATDALTTQGLEIARLSSITIDRLDTALSNRWSRRNPVDVAGDAVSYPCIWPLLEDENVDAVMVVGGVGGVGGLNTTLRRHPSFEDDYQRMMQVAEVEELANLDRLVELREKHGKPVIVTSQLIGSTETPSPRLHARMVESGLARFATPERGAKALARLVQYSEYLGAS